MNRLNKLNQSLDYWQRFLNLQKWDLKIKLVDFKRTDYSQSGDIEVDFKNKKATVLITAKETNKDNSIILHELIHLLFWEYDHFVEKFVKSQNKDKYFDLLEKNVADLTRIFLEKDK